MGVTDVGRIGEVMRFHLLRHGSPDVHPVMVACRDGDAGAEHEAQQEPSETGIGA